MTTGHAPADDAEEPGSRCVGDPGSCRAYAAYAGFSSRRGKSTAPFVTVAPTGS